MDENNLIHIEDGAESPFINDAQIAIFLDKSGPVAASLTAMGEVYRKQGLPDAAARCDQWARRVAG